MSHSKRNTSLAFFTSYERSLLKGDYGKQKSRLSRENFKNFDACNLCLLRARDPVACESNGDLFCKECAMENLLAQRKEIKRMQKELEIKMKEEEEEKVKEDEEARQRAIKDFELLQMGLEIRNATKEADLATHQTIVGRENGKLIMEETVVENGNSGLEPKSKKRKFELDEEELMRIAKEERQRVKTLITTEKKAASATKLPSFWVPSLTPSVVSTDMPKKELKLRSICPASQKNHIHYYSLKTLVTVNFTEEQEDKNKHGEQQRACPSCRKVLNNATKAMLAKPCGHVICKPCVEKFMTSQLDDPHNPSSKSVRCYVCDIDLTEKKKLSKDSDKDRIRPGLVQIQSDGTGFTAGGGTVTAEKEGIAFQC